MCQPRGRRDTGGGGDPLESYPGRSPVPDEHAFHPPEDRVARDETEIPSIAAIATVVAQNQVALSRQHLWSEVGASSIVESEGVTRLPEGLVGKTVALLD